MAYGLITKYGTREYLSGGVMPSFRDQGWGKKVFQHLISECKRPPYLEVLRTNKPAIKLYRKLGFKTVRTDNKRLIMKYAKKYRFI